MTVDVTTPIEVEAEVQTYTLVSDDIFMRRYELNEVPDWFKELIDSMILDSYAITDLNGLIAYLNSLSNGYNFKILNLEEANSVTNATLESLASRIDGNVAAVATLNITKVDADSATAISQNTVASYFADGAAAAWFDGKIFTYASAIEANASNVSVLSVVLDGQQVRIDSVESIAINAEGWAATASKLITAPDGSITGWSFTDGTNTQSEFNVYANSFKISDGVTGYTPFSIVGSEINFDGVVSINKVQSSIFIGEYATAPSTISVLIGGITYYLKDGDTYKNTTEGIVYFKSGTTWLSTAGVSPQGIIAGFTFIRSLTQPATPVGGTYYDPNPTTVGWSDGVPADNGMKLWTSTRWFTSDGLAPQDAAWNTPVVLGDTAYHNIQWNTSLTLPGDPGATGTSNGWTDDSTNAIWIASSTTYVNGAWSNWSIAKIKGENGDVGATGTRGTVSAISSTIYTAAPTNSQFYSVIAPIIGYGNAMVGDNVTYSRSDTSGGSFVGYCTAAGNPGTWLPGVALYVNGNAIITGTLSAGQLATGTIDANRLNIANATGTGFGINMSTGAGGIYVSAASNYYGLQVVGGKGISCISSPTVGEAGYFSALNGLTGIGTTGYGIRATCSSATAAGGDFTNTGGGNALKTNTGNVHIVNNLTVSGTITNFTGAHFSITGDTPELGDIMTVVDVMALDVTETYTRTDRTTIASDKSVIGVCSEKRGGAATALLILIEETVHNEEDGTSYTQIMPKYQPLYDVVVAGNYELITCNAVGEGMINVCNENGNITRGDYICSSSIAGKGMKQNDDLLHNYTVAKALESVDWSVETSTVKMISCTYHCG